MQFTIISEYNTQSAIFAHACMLCMSGITIDLCASGPKIPKVNLTLIAVLHCFSIVAIYML